jgi:hypothetical protein
LEQDFLERVGCKAKVSASFSEEKEAKGLFYSGATVVENPGYNATKVFAPLFSKKRLLT